MMVMMILLKYLWVYLWWFGEYFKRMQCIGKCVEAVFYASHVNNIFKTLLFLVWEVLEIFWYIQWALFSLNTHLHAYKKQTYAFQQFNELSTLDYAPFTIELNLWHHPNFLLICIKKYIKQWINFILKICVTMEINHLGPPAV